MNKTIYQNWIEIAYKEFAEIGPNFSLKALSNKAKLPRATFYYHFESKEELISELLLHHKQCTAIYFKDLETKVKNLIPDLYELLYAYKINLLFHHQLLKHKETDKFYEVYKDLNAQSYAILFPHLKLLFQPQGTDKDIVDFFNVLTDTWYTRLDIKNLSVDHMIELAVEILESTLGLYAGDGT